MLAEAWEVDFAGTAMDTAPAPAPAMAGIPQGASCGFVTRLAASDRAQETEDHKTAQRVSCVRTGAGAASGPCTAGRKPGKGSDNLKTVAINGGLNCVRNSEDNLPNCQFFANVKNPINKFFLRWAVFPATDRAVSFPAHVYACLHKSPFTLNHASAWLSDGPAGFLCVYAHACATSLRVYCMPMGPGAGKRAGAGMQVPARASPPMQASRIPASGIPREPGQVHPAYRQGSHPSRTPQSPHSCDMGASRAPCRERPGADVFSGTGSEGAGCAIPPPSPGIIPCGHTEAPPQSCAQGKAYSPHPPTRNG